MEKECVYCGEPFESKRSDAKYCSSTCRHKQHKQDKTKSNTVATTISDVVVDEVRSLPGGKIIETIANKTIAKTADKVSSQVAGKLSHKLAEFITPPSPQESIVKLDDNDANHDIKQTKTNTLLYKLRYIIAGATMVGFGYGGAKGGEVIHNFLTNDDDDKKEAPISKYYMRLGGMVIGAGLGWAIYKYKIMPSIQIPREAAMRDFISGSQQYMEERRKITTEQLRHYHTPYIRLSGLHADILGDEIDAPSLILIHGKPGRGKSYASVFLSKYFCVNLGMKTCYYAIEENSTPSNSFKKRFEEYQAYSPNYHIETNLKEPDDIIKDITANKYHCIIIDSSSAMQLSQEEEARFLHKLSKLNIGIIIDLVHQTKEGLFAGSKALAHLATMRIKMSDEGAYCMETEKYRVEPRMKKLYLQSTNGNIHLHNHSIVATR